MKRILIAVLVLGVIIAIAMGTQRRLPRVEQVADTAPGAVVAPRAGTTRAEGAAADTASADSVASAATSRTPVGGTGPERDDDEAQAYGASAPASATNARGAGKAVETTAVQSGQRPGADAILERASAAYADVRSMQADFAMTMTNPLLRRTTNSRGTLYQRRPDRIALRFSEPAGDVIVSDGRYFWIYYPSVDERQVIRMPASQGASGGVDLQAQFVGDPTERFEATMHGTERVGDRDAYVLTLEPRGPAAYRTLKVWLDTRDYLARRFEITEENGAVRRFDLSSVRTNLTLSDATFRFTPPADAQIVDRS